MKSSRLLPLIVACALFIENMDSTVLSTSLPAIAADLATDPIALKLALTTYLLALAVFIPVSGWVADRFGARATFVSAIAVFLARLGRLCAQRLAGRARGRPLRARRRRRDDGSGRPPRAAADRAEGRDRASAVVGHDPGARRADGRAAPRRLHYDVLRLALHLSHQSADRRARHDPRAALHSRHAGATAAARLARFRSRRRRAWRRDVRFLDARPASRARRSRRGCARAGSGRARGLRRARAAARARAARPRAIQACNVSRRCRRRLAVSHRYRRDAVPAAVDVAARVRAEPSGVGPSHIRLGDGRDLHEDARLPYAEGSWLQARAAVERAARVGLLCAPSGCSGRRHRNSSSWLRCSSAAVAVRCSSRA